jgi:hypothetical protein
MVATSDAVVLHECPTFGYGIRAMTDTPLSITSRKTLLNPPSATFVTDMGSRTNIFGTNALELGNVESLVSIAEMAFFVP